MARVIKRVAAKRDLTDHFVFLGENASVEVARRFLHACNVSFQALAQLDRLDDGCVAPAKIGVTVGVERQPQRHNSASIASCSAKAPSKARS